jgi:hypothetical protein
MERPKRPENYEFCLSLVGDPEETEFDEYVKKLENYCSVLEDENTYFAQFIEAFMQ